MAVEKLTIVTPVAVRFTERGLAELDGLAKLRGMERSEYVRHLVETAGAIEHAKWVALNELFGNSQSNSTEAG